MTYDEDDDRLYDHRPEFRDQPKFQVFAKKALHIRYEEIRKSMPAGTSDLDLIIELIEDNNARMYKMFMEHDHR